MDDDAALILLTFNSLSPLQLTAYGNEDARTPHFDELLKRADILYEYHAQPGRLTPQLDQLTEVLNSAGFACDRIVVETADDIENRTVQPHSFTQIELNLGPAPEVDAVDALLEAVLESITAPENCWWIITADRGGDLAKWQDFDARFAAAFSESLTRKLWAPLIIVSPERDRNARRHQQLLTATDLIPTIFDLLRIPPADGSSEVSVFTEPHRSELVLSDNKTCGLRTADRLLVVPRDLLEAPAELEFSTDWPQLFIKPDDRFDVNNLAVNEPERTAELLHRLQELITHAGREST